MTQENARQISSAINQLKDQIRQIRYTLLSFPDTEKTRSLLQDAEYNLMSASHEAFWSGNENRYNKEIK
jgi:uncharacterized protein (DUF1330 family)